MVNVLEDFEQPISEFREMSAVFQFLESHWVLSGIDLTAKEREGQEQFNQAMSALTGQDWSGSCPVKTLIGRVFDKAKDDAKDFLPESFHSLLNDKLQQREAELVAQDPVLKQVATFDSVSVFLLLMVLAVSRSNENRWGAMTLDKTLPDLMRSLSELIDGIETLRPKGLDDLVDNINKGNAFLLDTQNEIKRLSDDFEGHDFSQVLDMPIPALPVRLSLSKTYEFATEQQVPPFLMLIHQLYNHAFQLSVYNNGCNLKAEVESVLSRYEPQVFDHDVDALNERLIQGLPEHSVLRQIWKDYVNERHLSFFRLSPDELEEKKAGGYIDEETLKASLYRLIPEAQALDQSGDDQ